MSGPISPPSTIIVTGSSGFIGAHTISLLLQHGYYVVGTVRSQEKATAVQEMHANITPKCAHLLTTAIVPDMTDPDAYNAIFESVQPSAVLHLASPFSYTTTNFEQDLLKPAVLGTEAVLKACAHTSSVRRVVQTNSFACIYDAALGPRPGYTYTSRDWSPLTYDDGVNAPNAPVAYRASKAVAERLAWEFMESTGGFDFVSLCPAMVFGPFLESALPKSLKELNTSNQLVWDVVSAGEHGDVPPTKAPVWIDVRDLAEALVKALENSSVGGRRLLLAKGVYCNQEIADVARSIVSKQRHRMPIGNPGLREAETHFAVDASTAERELGMKWRSLKESLSDLLPQLYRIEAQSI